MIESERELIVDFSSRKMIKEHLNHLLEVASIQGNAARLEELLHKNRVLISASVIHELIINSVIGGHETAVDVLCKHYSDRLTSNDKGTYLIFAANHGHNSMVMKIIDYFGQTLPEKSIGKALVYAAEEGHSKVLESLLMNFRQSIAPDDIERAFRIAADKGFSSVVKQMTNQFGNILKTDDIVYALRRFSSRGETETIQMLLDQFRENINYNHIGMALVSACYGGRDQTVQFLMNSFNEMIPHEWIGRALTSASEKGNHSIIKTLTNEYGNLIDSADVEESFRCAADRGHLHVLNQLIYHYSGRMNPNDIGCGLLYAAEKGHTEIVETIMNRLEKHVTDEMKKKALHRSMGDGRSKRHYDVVSILKHGTFLRRLTTELQAFEKQNKTVVNEIKQCIENATIEQKKTISDILNKNPHTYKTFLKETNKFRHIIKHSDFPKEITEKILTLANSRVQGLPITIAIKLLDMSRNRMLIPCQKEFKNVEKSQMKNLEVNRCIH